MESTSGLYQPGLYQREPQTLWTLTSSSERTLTKYRTTLQVCYFLLYVVTISLIVCQNALYHFDY